ncbi:hypothetical protein LTS18_011501, partial [Coniosporium uncinatum]
MELATSHDERADPRPERHGQESDNVYRSTRTSLDDATGSSDPEKDVEKADDRSGASPIKPSRQNDLVEFDGPDDPGDPKNWTKNRRWAITASMGSMTFVVTFASSVFSVATAP